MMHFCGHCENVMALRRALGDKQVFSRVKPGSALCFEISDKTVEIYELYLSADNDKIMKEPFKVLPSTSVTELITYLDIKLAHKPI